MYFPLFIIAMKDLVKELINKLFYVSDEYLYCQTISESTRRADTILSAKHCQMWSVILVYESCCFRFQLQDTKAETQKRGSFKNFFEKNEKS